MTSRINKNVCMYVCIEIKSSSYPTARKYLGHLVHERQECFAERRTPSDSSCRPQLIRVAVTRSLTKGLLRQDFTCRDLCWFAPFEICPI